MAPRTKSVLQMEPEKSRGTPREPKSITNESAEADMRRKAILAEMEIGHGLVDFLDPEVKFEFGKWNPRSIVQLEVRKLRKSFQDFGVRVEESPIPLVVRRSDVVEGTYRMGTPARGCPEVVFKGKVTVFAAGGQHRREAMRQVKEEAMAMATNEQQKTALAKKNEKIKGLEARKDKYFEEKKMGKTFEMDALIQEVKHEIAKLERDKEIVEKNLQTGKWIAILYDYDMLMAHEEAFALGALLSTNQRFYAYEETKEERLVGFLREYDMLHKDDKPQYLETMMKVGAKQSIRLACQSDTLMPFLMYMSRAHHFSSSKLLYVVEWITKKMLGTIGGFVVEAASDMLHMWNVIFDETPYIQTPGYKEAAQTVLDYDGKTDEETLRTQTAAQKIVRAEYRKVMGRSRPYNNIVKVDTLSTVERIDSHFKKQLYPYITSFCQTRDRVLDKERESEWFAAMLKYATMVRCTLQSERMFILHYPSALDRFDVLMMGDGIHGRTLLPLLTESVLVALVESLQGLEEGFCEIAKWIDPLVEPSEMLRKTTKLSVKEIEPDKMNADDITGQLYRNLLKTPMYCGEKDIDESLAWELHDVFCELIGDGRLAKLVGTIKAYEDPEKRRNIWRQADKWIRENDMTAAKETVTKSLLDVAKSLRTTPRQVGNLFITSRPDMKADYYRIFETTGFPWAEIDSRSRTREYAKLASWAVIVTKRTNEVWPYQKDDKLYLSVAHTVRARLQRWLTVNKLGTEFYLWFGPLHDASSKAITLDSSIFDPMKDQKMKFVISMKSREEQRRQLQDFVNSALKLSAFHSLPVEFLEGKEYGVCERALFLLKDLVKEMEMNLAEQRLFATHETNYVIENPEDSALGIEFPPASMGSLKSYVLHYVDGKQRESVLKDIARTKGWLKRKKDKAKGKKVTRPTAKKDNATGSKATAPMDKGKATGKKPPGPKRRVVSKAVIEDEDEEPSQQATTSKNPLELAGTESFNLDDDDEDDDDDEVEGNGAEGNRENEPTENEEADPSREKSDLPRDDADSSSDEDDPLHDGNKSDDRRSDDEPDEEPTVTDVDMSGQADASADRIEIDDSLFVDPQSPTPSATQHQATEMDVDTPEACGFLDIDRMTATQLNEAMEEADLDTTVRKLKLSESSATSARVREAATAREFAASTAPVDGDSDDPVDSDEATRAQPGNAAPVQKTGTALSSRGMSAPAPLLNLKRIALGSPASESADKAAPVQKTGTAHDSRSMSVPFRPPNAGAVAPVLQTSSARETHLLPPELKTIPPSPPANGDGLAPRRSNRTVSRLTTPEPLAAEGDSHSKKRRSASPPPTQPSRAKSKKRVNNL